MTNSRNKGVRGEREWRDVLRAAGWVGAERGQQHRGGPGSPDILGGPANTHAEVKFGATLNLYAALEQSVGDAAPGELPYVAFRRCMRGQPDRGWIVILTDLDFFELIRLRERDERDRMAHDGTSAKETCR